MSPPRGTVYEIGGAPIIEAFFGKWVHQSENQQLKTFGGALNTLDAGLWFVVSLFFDCFSLPSLSIHTTDDLQLLFFLWLKTGKRDGNSFVLLSLSPIYFWQPKFQKKEEENLPLSFPFFFSSSCKIPVFRTAETTVFQGISRFPTRTSVLE